MASLRSKLGVGVMVVIGFIVFMVFLTAYRKIDTYEVAVTKNVFTGTVHEDVRRQGAHFIPFVDWTVYSTRIQDYPGDGEAEVIETRTADQMDLKVEANYRWRVAPDSVVAAYLNFGGMDELAKFTYEAFRSATRDVVAGVDATGLLSTERNDITPRILDQFQKKLSGSPVQLTHFFVRDIAPPPAVEKAINRKMEREQQVQTERFQTEVVAEKARQRRVKAEGIRDEQNIIAESLLGPRGRRFLQWRYYEVLQAAARGQNNLILGSQDMPIIADMAR